MDKRYSFVVSLPTKDNDYQRHQAAAAEEAARAVGVDVKIVWADGDPVQQSQQILTAIQTSTPERRTDGIIMQSIGTEHQRAAEAAAAAGIGWVVLQREYSYPAALRARGKGPIFALTCDHTESGRIQGRQLARLLPRPGIVLCILGPSSDKIATLRLAGLQETNPAHLELRTIRGRWTEQSGEDAINIWLRLSTSLQTPIAAIASQNDDMAIGARNALQNSSNAAAKKILTAPLLGIDGVPSAGQSWVQRGWLTSTISMPPLAGIAVTMLAKALQSGIQPPENTSINGEPYPELQRLQPVAADSTGVNSVFR